MAWLIGADNSFRNYVDLDFYQDDACTVRCESSFVMDGDPPLERERRFAAKLRTPRKTVPSLWRMQDRYCVDERLRSSVEALEPGVHIFDPLVLRRKNGELLDGGPYYTVYFQGRIACLAPEASNVALIRWSETSEGSYSLAKGEKILAVHKAAIAGRHVWFCKQWNHGFMISDALYEQFKSKRLTGFTTMPVREV